MTERCSNSQPDVALNLRLHVFHQALLVVIRMLRLLCAGNCATAQSTHENKWRLSHPKRTLVGGDCYGDTFEIWIQWKEEVGHNPAVCTGTSLQFWGVLWPRTWPLWKHALSHIFRYQGMSYDSRLTLSSRSGNFCEALYEWWREWGRYFVSQYFGPLEAQPTANHTLWSTAVPHALSLSAVALGAPVPLMIFG